MALSSLIAKEKKKVEALPATFHHQRNHESPVLHDSFNSPNSHHLNGFAYKGPRPNFPIKAPDMYPGAVHQPMYRPYHQPMPQPSFAPRRPPFPRPLMMPVQPHVNPHFVAPHNPQHSSMFIPPGQELPHMHVMGPTDSEEDMPILPEVNGVFVPTPPARLSPRSAQ